MKPKGSQFMWTTPKELHKSDQGDHHQAHTSPPAQHHFSVYGDNPRPQLRTSLHRELDAWDASEAEGRGYANPVAEEGQIWVDLPIREWDTPDLLRKSSWKHREKKGKKPVKDKSTKQKLKYTNTEGEKVKEKVVQQQLFDPQHTAGWENQSKDPVVGYAEFTKTGAKRFGEGLGILQNEVARRGFGPLQPDTDLSPHSSRLVENLQKRGHVSADFKQTDSNQMDFIETEITSGHVGAPANSQWGYVSDERRRAGMATTRKVLGGDRRAKLRADKAARMNVPFPGMEE